MIKRQLVESSNLASIGYDRGKSILEVEFKDGSIYQYKNVPHGHWAMLVVAPSVGTFFANNIRGKFETEQIKEKRK